MMADLDAGVNESFVLATTDFLSRRFGLTDVDALAVVKQLMSASLDGHGCLDLSDRPDAIAMLREISGLLSVISDRDIAETDPGAITAPLVAWRQLLFTQRHFCEELRVARQVVMRQQMSSSDSMTAFSDLDYLADRLLPPIQSDQSPTGTDDSQNGAAKGVLRSSLTVLTGGPGTGKTHTLVRCLALVIKGYLNQGVEPLVAVCAPTGKAATRAKEIIDKFAADGEVGTLVGADVVELVKRIAPTTVHRLLGSRLSSSTRTPDTKSDYLPYHVVIVDESSMMSTSLMSSLLASVSPKTRVVLVGDSAQLESVEVGAVLGEIVSVAEYLGGAVHELRHIHRVVEGSQISLLAAAIRAGDADKVMAQLESGHETTRWCRIDSGRRPPKNIVDEIAATLRKAVESARSAKSSEENLRESLKVMNSNKVLCGPRASAAGVSAWNAAIADALGLTFVDPPPPGTPVLITINTPKLGLVNGSVGLAVAADHGGEHRERVAFEDGNSIRYFEWGQLPQYEVCFAMTVHKSQGSEYGGLLVVALPGVGSPLLVRELFYTGVTRGKQDVLVVADEDSIRSATETPSNRSSAIGEMIKVLVGGDVAVRGSGMT